MSKCTSLTVSKIVNWTGSRANTPIQLCFLSARAEYLGHKSLLGYYQSSILLLNSSFKINYEPWENTISCKVSLLTHSNRIQTIGEVIINLDDLNSNRALFLPLNGPNDILKVEIDDLLKKSKSTDTISHGDADDVRREQFIKARQQFLEDSNMRQFQMRRNFTDRIEKLLVQFKGNPEQNENPFQKKSTKTVKSINEFQEVQRIQRQGKIDRAIESRISSKKFHLNSIQKRQKIKSYFTDKNVERSLERQRSGSFRNQAPTSMRLIGDLIDEDIFKYANQPEDYEY